MNITRFGRNSKPIPVNGNNDIGYIEVNNSQDAMQNDLIDEEFLNLLKPEADIYMDACQQLDNDKTFKQPVQKMSNTTDIIVNDPMLGSCLLRMLSNCMKCAAKLTVRLLGENSLR